MNGIARARIPTTINGAAWINALSNTANERAKLMLGRIPQEARIVSIGPVTSDAVREAGLSVAVEAERHDPEGLLEALLADATKQDR